MNQDAAQHEYRVLSVDGEPTEPLVRATVDLDSATLAVQVPDGPRISIDVVTARALYMLLGEAVYCSLAPTGPFLRLERNTDGDWTH
ncbi:MAG: hypothetical protein WCA46_09385 [Actinocatenispora sp.]